MMMVYKKFARAFSDTSIRGVVFQQYEVKTL